MTLHNVLLVDDSFPDVILMEEAFGATVKQLHLSHVEDGVEALAFLRREGPYTGAPRPKLVLLDLNMPRMNGFEVLSHIRADPVLRGLPVLVFSTSKEERDIQQAYDLGANAFLTKPRDLSGAIALVQVIEQFWLVKAQLPGGA
ncbi:response regulator [Deinococcus humi]|uniref:CheY-like chemotaxis protein n=1 Tax=Deinococcus humi TaxID=662880 RepID=A0A7W8JYZ6_9DEIO|nr:response regulator [Deinococcus humi]MBB5365802.1 CheY-like chemotaxis protein [Deinococcus humi]